MADGKVSARAAVIGVGARTHNGLTALQVAMSCRANIMQPVESHMVDRHGEPIAMCRLMPLGDRLQGLERLEALAVPALAEALHAYGDAVAGGRASRGPLPLCLALPASDRADMVGHRRDALLERLRQTAPLPIDDRGSRVFAGGRSAGVEAFEHALGLLGGGAPAVVVGGVDSYFHPDVLEHLDEVRRLHSMETENGFIPGEGAAFLLLARDGSTAGILPHGYVLSATTTTEPHPWHPLAPPNAEPCLAVGMTLAVDTAARAADAPIGWILTDVNNERHRVDEWIYASLRNARVFEDDAEHEQPTLDTGDLGAASAAVLAVIACMRWRTRSAVSPYALLALHADGPGRGAMTMAEAR